MQRILGTQGKRLATNARKSYRGTNTVRSFFSDISGNILIFSLETTYYKNSNDSALLFQTTKQTLIVLESTYAKFEKHTTG